jgi:hypothetical protein
MAAGATEVRAAVERFFQKAFVKRTAPGFSQCQDIDPFTEVARDGGEMACGADGTSVAGQWGTTAEKQDSKDE